MDPVAGWSDFHVAIVGATAALALIPGIPAPALGGGALALAALGAVFAASAGVRIVQNRHPENRLRALKILLAALAPIVYGAGGVLLLLGAESAGLTAFAIGAITAIIASLLVSWIVLVEVLR
ncbi:hypothetical protein ACIQLJ_08205 [Microbacterium sp. NPDC091313]